MSPGIWNTQSSFRRLTITTARNARSRRPASPPNSWNDCTTLMVCSCAIPESSDTPASPGTMRGICCTAPNAAAYAHAIMIVVTIVVRRNSGVNNAAKLGRLSVPASFLARHVGDSGRNGRMIISGIAGMSPEMSV